MMSKSQRGSGHLFSLMVIALIVWGGYVTLYVPYEHRKSMDAFRGKPPALSPAKLALVDEYKRKPEPETLPQGLYLGTQEQDGYPLNISFSFGDGQTLTKRAQIKENLFSGSAVYRLEGSAMIFSQIKGDRVLFAEAGEPLEVISAEEIHIPGPDAPLVLKRQ